MFTSIYPLATCGSDIYLWIPHTPAALCRQGSWPELFNYFPLGLLNWARPSAQYLHFLWAKHLWNGTKHAGGIRENFVFLYTIDKNVLHSGSSYIYFLGWKGDTKASPLSLWLAYPTLIVHGNLNSSAIWLLPSRCLTSFKHICKVTTWMQRFSEWFALFWPICIPYSIWIPAQPLGDSFLPYSEEVHIDGHADERDDHEYYNEIPGKQPPMGGVSDVRVRVQATEQMAYCPIRCEKLCYLVSNILLWLELAKWFCPYH